VTEPSIKQLCSEENDEIAFTLFSNRPGRGPKNNLSPQDEWSNLTSEERMVWRRKAFHGEAA
jgi:hypothetical protein